MASDCSASAARASLASATVLARLALSLALASSMDWSFTNRLARAYFTCSASFSFPAGVQPSPASEARCDDSGSLCISRRRSCRRSIVSHCACSSRVEASYLLRSSASAPSVAMMAGGGVSRYGCPSRSCRNVFASTACWRPPLVDWKVSGVHDHFSTERNVLCVDTAHRRTCKQSQKYSNYRWIRTAGVPFGNSNLVAGSGR